MNDLDKTRGLYGKDSKDPARVHDDHDDDDDDFDWDAIDDDEADSNEGDWEYDLEDDWENDLEEEDDDDQFTDLYARHDEFRHVKGLQHFRDEDELAYSGAKYKPWRRDRQPFKMFNEDNYNAQNGDY